MAGEIEYYRNNTFMNSLGGDSPVNRVIEYFMHQQDTPVTLKDVMGATSLGKESASDALYQMKEMGIVKAIGIAYVLDMDHAKVAGLMEIHGQSISATLQAAKRQYGKH